MVACSVRFRRRFGEGSDDQLSVNARHANDLGADVVHVEGRRIAEQLVRVARERAGHTIVVGRPPRYAHWIPWRENIVQGIARRAPDITLCISPSRPAAETEAGRTAPEVTALTRRSPSHRWFSAALLMTIAVGMSMVVDRLAGGDANTIMILLAGVLFSSALGNRTTGLLSSVLAVLSFNFFFTEPRYTLVVDDSSYLVTFPVMLVVAFVTSELTSRLNTSVDLARTREKRAETLYRNSEQLLSARGVTVITETVASNLSRLLQRRVTIATADQGVTQGGHLSSGHPGTVFTVATETESLGTIHVEDHEQPLSVGSVALVNAFAAQLAIALDRERLTLAEESARLHAERERVRANLLRSVSHDLRTPLASIAGSASILLQLASVPPDHRRLLEDIETDSMWLSGIVENILSLTRLSDETMALQTSEEVLEEIILEVVERVSRRVGAKRFDLVFPVEIIMVTVDVSLVEQMLINVLGNATDFDRGPGPIRVEAVMADETTVSICVQDHGPGIPDEEIERVFDLFYTRKNDEDSRRGLGVGLTVARTIVELHGGTIRLTNAHSGGLDVTIRLPARSASPGGDS